MKTYLPRIQIDYGSGVSTLCGMNQRSIAFVEAWLSLLGDRAKILHCDERLVQCAQDHASYLNSRTEEEIAALAGVSHAMHRSRDGRLSNRRVRDAGYHLPDYYPDDKNSVESCARNDAVPDIAAKQLAEHTEHHDHLYGIGSFFSKQTVYGVGNAGDDWVILICPPE